MGETEKTASGKTNKLGCIYLLGSFGVVFYLLLWVLGAFSSGLPNGLTTGVGIAGIFFAAQHVLGAVRLQFWENNLVHYCDNGPRILKMFLGYTVDMVADPEKNGSKTPDRRRRMP